MRVEELIKKLSKYNPDSELVLSITKKNEIIEKSIDIDVFENWDKTIHISTDENNIQ